MNQERKTKLYWPSPQDYSEAVQTARVSFADEELASATVECNDLGLPICMSGNFASVFCFKNGVKKFAVRCFLHTITDEGLRYGAISEVMREQELSCTVPFKYLENGIRVNGNWYPILKMDWVTGDSLSKFVESALGNPMTLNLLAGYFKQSLIDLNRAGIAHGDLQHDNILVSKSELRLVDYDGMFVASLAGQQAKELGHPNYQHPDRASRHYGPYLDNFSAWLIFSSLRILSTDPSLYKKFDGGADCLLFRKADLANANGSELFRTLEAHDEQELRWFAHALRRFLNMDVEKVPPLKGQIHDLIENVVILPVHSRQESPQPASQDPPTDTLKVADWLRDAIETKTNKEASALANAVVAAQAAPGSAKAANLAAPAAMAAPHAGNLSAQPPPPPLTAVQKSKKAHLSGHHSATKSGQYVVIKASPFQPANLPAAPSKAGTAAVSQNQNQAGLQKQYVPSRPIKVKLISVDSKLPPKTMIDQLLTNGETILWYSVPKFWTSSPHLLILFILSQTVLLFLLVVNPGFAALVIGALLMLFVLSDFAAMQGAFVTNRRLIICDRRLHGFKVTLVDLSAIDEFVCSTIDRAVLVSARREWANAGTKRLKIHCTEAQSRNELVNLLSQMRPAKMP
ncbi:MAG TPA: serine/threonine-protein kinase [Planktothrix sp.]|jgi:serine/threonine protein kinase